MPDGIFTGGSPNGTIHKPGTVGQSLEQFADGIFTIDRAESRDRFVRTGVLTAARLLDEQSRANGRKPNCMFVTLTYRGVDDWRPHHFKNFAKCLREWCRRRGARFRYVFKAELQQRGAVHYHLIVWLPKGITLPKPDKQGWWPHGMTQRVRVEKNAVGYIAKYCAKVTPGGHKFPRGCRLHGSGGLTGDKLNEQRWWKLPTWARKVFTVEDRPIRVKGGGLRARSDGRYHASPYCVVSAGQGKVSIVLRAING